MAQSLSKNILGNNIRALRTGHGETQEQLGKALGYVSTTIANYESGFRKPDIQTIQQIANHYKVTIDYLLMVHEEPNIK